MKFSELAVGAQFRFYRRGKPLTKTSKDTYTSVAGQQVKARPDADVLPEEQHQVPSSPPVPPRPDDVALISKTLDALEAKAGRSEELTAARDALRRLSALANLKIRR